MRWQSAVSAAAPGRAGWPEPPRWSRAASALPWSSGKGETQERRVPALLPRTAEGAEPAPPPRPESRGSHPQAGRPGSAGASEGSGGAPSEGAAGEAGAEAIAAMPGPLGLLCFLALGLRGSGEPSGAAPSLCAAPCSCDGDRRVDCSGKGLTAVPEGLSAFTLAL